VYNLSTLQVWGCIRPRQGQPGPGRARPVGAGQGRAREGQGRAWQGRAGQGLEQGRAGPFVVVGPKQQQAGRAEQGRSNILGVLLTV
jgi:hypothetical protein